MINVVLLIAVIILFWLHFSSKGSAATAAKPKHDSASPKLSFTIPSNLKGAHVLSINLDSIDAKYQAIIDLNTERNGNINYLQTQYATKQEQYQTKYQQLAQGAQSGTLSTVEATKLQDEVKALETELAGLENQLKALNAADAKKNDKIMADVNTYFKEYSKENKVDYIVGVGGGSSVMYANDSLDVTNEVVDALNAQYKLIKGKTTTTTTTPTTTPKK